MLNKLQLLVLTGLFSFVAMPVLGAEISLDGEIALVEKSPSPLIPQSPSQPSSINLLAQNNLTRVTGVEINQTGGELELILKTSAGSERLVPLILPEGNDLVIDILDATLAFSIRNGVTELNPAPGIDKITLNKNSGNSIRVRITGANQTPNAEVVPGRDNLVLSVTPQDTTAESKPDEEIEIIATGEAEGDDDSYSVDDATTATRTDTPLKDVPQSVQVVPQQVIKDQQAQELQDITRNVSGVFEGSTFGDTQDRFFIRGFDQQIFLQDGFRDETQQIRETANIERIEVLKGPASVLYGTLEPGGIINRVTKKPLVDPLYSAELTVGSFSFVEPSIDLGGPLNEDKTLLYRFNALYENSDVFRDFDQGVEQIFIAPSLTWKIGDRTDITFNLEYIDREAPFDRGIPAIGDGVADIPFERVIGEPDDFIETENFKVNYILEHRFSDNWKLRNSFSYTNSERFTSYARVIELDEETGIVSRYWNQGEEPRKNYSLQTNVVGEFATGSVEHTLLFGVDLFRLTEEATGFFSEDPNNPGEVGGAPDLNIFNPEYGVAARPETNETTQNFIADTQNDSLGIYLQDRVELGSQWHLLAGGRFDIIDQESSQVSSVFGNSDDQLQDEAFSPRLGVVYQPIEPLSLYASFTQSFTPNNAVDEEGELLEPERGTQYEAGIKGEFLDGDMSATLAAFNINKTNIAIADPVLDNVSRPIGEQRSRGIELDVRGEILPGWNIITSYAYTDAEITEDDNSEAEGNRLVGVPENAASLWTTYEIQNGNLQGLGFGAGLFLLGEREGDTDNSFQVPSYTRTDASIFYQRDKWRAAVNFKNLFDIDYIESATNRRRISPGIPFTVLGSISVEF